MRIQVYKNPRTGAIKVYGEVDVVDEDGKVLESYLNPNFCGCGKSKSVRCDGSHKKGKENV